MKPYLAAAAILLTVGVGAAAAQLDGRAPASSTNSGNSTSSGGQYTGNSVAGALNDGGTANPADMQTGGHQSFGTGPAQSDSSAGNLQQGPPAIAATADLCRRIVRNIGHFAVTR
jgi:hypothetical protein